MNLRRDESGRSAIVPILIVVLVLALFAWQVGLLDKYLGTQPPVGPNGQTFDISVSDFSDPVASSVQTTSDGSISIEGSNVVLSNGGGTYTATFKLNVRDTKTGDQQGAPFTMKVAVGSWMSPSSGLSWSILAKDSSQCPDISYSVSAGGTGVKLGCDQFQGSISTDGGSLAITVTIIVNGDLFGTGMPSVGVPIPLTFSIVGASDAGLVWKASS